MDVIYGLRISVLLYIVMAPTIYHDPNCMFNDPLVKFFLLIVSASFLGLDVVLGILMIFASLIAIGMLNFASITAAMAPVEMQSHHPSITSNVVHSTTVTADATAGASSTNEKDEAAPNISSKNESAANTVNVTESFTAAPVKVSTQVTDPLGSGDLCVKEIHKPLDFLSDPLLNPSGFVTQENLQNIQSSGISQDYLSRQYSPLGGNVYTAQGALSGLSILGADGS